MAEILKVTTPLVNKNQPVPPKPGVEPAGVFNITDASKVLQAHNQSEVLGQNTGTLDGGSAPTLLLDLLKDPSVTASYLKNIFLLEEIFQLLPANNKTVTPEIEQLFSALMVRQSSGAAAEMTRQQDASTAFRGELFDFLREVAAPDAPEEVQQAVAAVLKAVNNQLARRDILDAVANSFSYLQRAFGASRSLGARLGALAAGFRAPEAGGNFAALKAQALGLLRELENSVLFSDGFEKVLSITKYNLSRYNDNDEYLAQALRLLRQQLPAPQRQKLSALARALVQGPADAPRRGDGSGVMRALTELLSRQAGREDLSATEAGKLEKILHSLLSSPCNFTPLLHFIIPLEQDGARAFAEMWINPDSDEKDMPPGAGPGRHFLLVIDIEGTGRFEAELFVHGKIIDFSLYCPAGAAEKYRGLTQDVRRLLAPSSYRLGRTRLETLETPRSLMDVFKSLPYKRVGVDVKI